MYADDIISMCCCRQVWTDPEWETIELVGRGGSRIPRRRGRQSSGGGGASTYEFARFSQKLREDKKILVRRME